MEHTFFCDRCGKRFDVDAALIGKRARCKDCKHEFVIPGVPSRPSPPDPYGWNDPPPLPTPAHQNPYALVEDEVLPPRLGKPDPPPKRRRRSSDGFAWIKPMTMFGIAVGLMLLLNVAMFAHSRPPLAYIAFTLLGLLCLFMIVSGYVISLIIPFFDDTTTGFLCFFVPFYKLNYWWNHQETMTRPLMLSLTGMVLAGAGVGLAFFLQGNPAALDLNMPGGVATNRQYEELIEREMATYYDMKDLLAKVSSAEEAQSVAERYTTLANQFSGLQKQSKELSRDPWQISGEQINRLHGEEYKHAQSQYLFEAIRVSKIEGVTAILKLDRYAWQSRFLPRAPVAKAAPAVPRIAVAHPQPEPPVPAEPLPAARPRPRVVAPAPRDLAQKGEDRRDPGPVPERDARSTPAPRRVGPFARKPAALKPQEPRSDSPAQLAELLGTPQKARAIAALKAMGPAAEDAVIPVLRSDNWFARMDACQVLKVIGTEKSVSELSVIAENNGPSKQYAREALLEIARRGGAGILEPPGGIRQRIKPQDYQACVALIAEAGLRPPIRLLACCAMPNHFHRALRPVDDGDLSRWMHGLLTTHPRRYLAHALSWPNDADRGVTRPRFETAFDFMILECSLPRGRPAG